MSDKSKDTQLIRKCPNDPGEEEAFTHIICILCERVSLLPVQRHRISHE